MASPQLQTIVQMLRSAPARESGDYEAGRAAIEAAANAFPTPTDVELRPVDADSVPAEWIAPPGTDSETVLYYLHGGGYCIGSINSHREMISRISRAAGVRALAIDYRLAPEHPFPAGLEDALTGYRWLLAQGIDAARIVIAGDSAGGGLTLAALLSLRDKGEPLPAAAVLLSPWTDMTHSGDSIRTRAELDPMIKPDDSNTVGNLYMNGVDPKSPLVSPVFADLSGLPPMLIQVGDHEVLLDDSTRLEANAKKAGVDVTLEVWDEMIHVFQFFAAMLPEGQQAIDRIGEYIRQHVPAKTTA